MSLSLKERFNYNLYLWLFGLTKVRMINFVSPRIIDIDDTKAVINVPLNIKTRNHVKSMYIGSMGVGVDLIVGFSAYLQTKKKNRKIVIIFKDLKADFIKRAEGDTLFSCNSLKQINDAISKAIDTGERVNLPVPVTATVPSVFGDEPVAEFVITLSVKEK